MLAMVTLDCPDPQASATFWSSLLGWTIAHAETDYAMLTGPSHALGFGRVENYEPPAWPNERGSKQFHFDLAVADLDSAAKSAVELGATMPADQPGWASVLPDESGELGLADRCAGTWGSRVCHPVRPTA
jgi:catechol 2,3-dioxygenase-like lactoylglutathione lyase family enzyme